MLQKAKDNCTTQERGGKRKRKKRRLAKAEIVEEKKRRVMRRVRLMWVTSASFLGGHAVVPVSHSEGGKKRVRRPLRPNYTRRKIRATP